MTEPKEPRPIIDILCEATGLERSDALELVHRAGWDGDRFRAELRGEGWLEKLRADAAAEVGAESRLQSRLERVVTGAPGPLACMRVPALVALLKNQKLREFAERYDPFEHGGRLLAGPTGIGKSVASAAVVRRFVEGNVRLSASPQGRGEGFSEYTKRTRGKSIEWSRAFDLANARLEHALGRGEAEAIQRATKVEFLILDDIGWESNRAGGADVIPEVIAERYDAGLPTCATTGLRVSQFMERYGEAVTRRIVEAGGPKGKVLDLWSPEPKP